jgi:6-phosphogluconolactonase (cycloisomerase 2 family)
MATQTVFSRPSISISHGGIRASSRVLQILLVLSSLFSFISKVNAQTSQQQYVYSSGALNPPSSSVISGFSKASQTGALSSIPGSPFSERFEGGLVAIDGQGKFLFVLDPKINEISMFQINQTSGALSEVFGSPFQVPSSFPPNPPPSQPISIATEKSGKFLFVGYYTGDVQGDSSVVSLSIDTSGPNPAIVTQQSTPIFGGGAPIQLLTDPKGLHLYVGLRHGQNQVANGGAQVYSIDSSTGRLSYQGPADTLNTDGLSYAIDPGDRFFYAGGFGNYGPIESCLISPVDGTANGAGNTCQPFFNLGGLGDHPSTMLAENSGHFLYIAESTTGVADAGAVVFSIDQTTGALTQVLGPLTSVTLGPGASVADPMGPFIYSVLSQGIHVYQVDQQSGNLTEIPGSPFNAGMTGVVSALGLAISGNPIQAVSGPAATIYPSTGYSGGTIAVGSSGPTGVFSLVNVGDQPLTINSFSIVGPNASSFSQSHTCTATLATNANCSISINFMPASTGTFSATLQVADNAPGSPQTIALSGTGATPAPAITFSPAAPSFPTITEGTVGAAQTLTVLNTGTAPLHVSPVSIAGPNPLDFSFTNNCISPVAPSASCTILLVFNPIGPGQRNANLTIADDAPGSPQTISLSATANPAVTPGPAPNGSTTASVTAGQTAQYLLQLTPGAGYSGTVSLTCSGAPLNATCQVPANVTVANGVPAPFTVTVSTRGGAMLPRSMPWHFVPPARIRVLLLLAFALLLVVIARNHWMFDGALRAWRLGWSGGAIAAILLCSVVYAAGCGSSVTTTPPPIVTPPGTSTITITMSAMSPTQQPLQLPPIQLTLTVK